MDLDEEGAEELLRTLEECVPVIPDEVVTYYMERAGFTTPDNRVRRLIALAAQKFVSDIVSDALQHHKIRTGPRDKRTNQAKDKRLTLTMEDLSASLCEYGVNVRKPEYFSERQGTCTVPAVPPPTKK